MAMLIRGGRVLDAANNLDQKADVLIRDGRVAAVGQGLGDADTTIDATGKWVLPGLVDLHARLREPGQEYKEDIASGSRAAAAGGFTTLCVMPGTLPVNDRRSVTEHIRKRATESALVHIEVVGALTEGMEGRKLNELYDMQEAGIIAACDDDRSVLDSGLMRRALEYADTYGLVVMAHCEDRGLTKGTAMNEGPVSTACGLPAQPAVAETIMLARDLALVELTGARYHAQHISTRGAVRMIREAKGRGLPVTCEVAAHHLVLTDAACAGYDTNTKVRPPLRSQNDVDALREAVADGTVDAIVSDHAPHSILEKELEYGYAAFGASSLETTLALCLGLVRADVLKLPRLVELLTAGPAKVLGLKAGTLAVGAAADVTVVDSEQPWVVRAEDMQSKGKNTPFLGQEFLGQVVATLVDGKLVYERPAPR